MSATMTAIPTASNVPTGAATSEKPTYTKHKLSILPIRIIITIYVLLVMYALFIIAFAIQAVAWIITLPILLTSSNKLRSFRIQFIGFIFRYILSTLSTLNPFWRVKFYGKLPANRPKRLLVMSNHVSNLDPFITCRTLIPWETKYISKSSLFNVPFGGWCMSLANDLPVYFTKEKGGWGLKKGSVGVLMDTCKKFVCDYNIPITVYPEGARTGSLVLKDFKPGMFSFAVENDCYILPLGMIGTQYAWPIWSSTLDAASISVNIGQLIPPIQDNNMTKDEKVNKLMEIVRQEIEKLMKEIPSYPKNNKSQ